MLLSIPGKVFCSILPRWLWDDVDQNLHEEQAGFRKEDPVLSWENLRLENDYWKSIYCNHSSNIKQKILIYALTIKNYLEVTNQFTKQLQSVIKETYTWEVRSHQKDTRTVMLPVELAKAFGVLCLNYIWRNLSI